MTTEAADSVGVLELLELSNNERLGRATNAAERAAAALERIATTGETLVALFASVIGTGFATCYPADSTGKITTPLVNYFRTGNGDGGFKCDAEDDDGE